MLKVNNKGPKQKAILMSDTNFKGESIISISHEVLPKFLMFSIYVSSFRTNSLGFIANKNSQNNI